tara:strand:- start:909 stop:2321 length:1413 start_codon:yes stop_codon:yes gene_type:complete
METIISGNTVRRLVSNKGNTKAFYNDEPVTLNSLKKQMETSVDFHGQYDQQMILDVKNHILYLDRYCGIDRDVKEIQDLFQEIMKSRTELDNLCKSSLDRKNHLELLNFQAREIDAVSISIDEDNELDKVYRKLCNLNKINDRLHDIQYNIIDGDNTAVDMINQSLRDLESLCKYDEGLNIIKELMQDAIINLQESGSEITKHLSDVEFDPSEFSDIEDRIQILETLKRKYGGSLEAVLDYRRSIQKEIDNLNKNSFSEKALTNAIKILENKYSKLAIDLNSIRNTHAVALASKVERAMKELNMPNSNFEIRITQLPIKNGFVSFEGKFVESGINGIDQVEFYLSTNPGEPVKPLNIIASGGEISRIMLAIKTVFQRSDPVTTLVFDEIDTGISGKAAECVAEQLVTLSQSKQVLCITHLSQIAGRADHHLHITKSSDYRRTKVIANYLNSKERNEVMKELFTNIKIFDM